MSYRIPPGWSGNSYMDACDRERELEANLDALNVLVGQWMSDAPTAGPTDDDLDTMSREEQRRLAIGRRRRAEVGNDCDAGGDDGSECEW